MATISDLASASAILRNAACLSDAEYERQICDHVKYCRQLLSTRALESIARDDLLFDVSLAAPSACFRCGRALTNRIVRRILTQKAIPLPIFFFFDCRFRPSSGRLVTRHQRNYCLRERCGRELHATCGFSTVVKLDTPAWNGASSLSL